MTQRSEKPVQIDIVAGFLGAGKTTFILNLLKHNPNERILLCENEFGSASIDAALLRNRTTSDPQYEVFELREGCVCCTLAGELVAGLLQAIDRFSPDRVIIEPTGLARLSDVLSALRSPDLAGRIEIDARVLLIDGLRLAKHFAKFLHHFGDGLRDASHVFVTKTEQYTQEEKASVLFSLHEAYPHLIAKTLPFDGDLWEFVHSTAAVPPALAESGKADAPADDSTAGYTALSFPTRHAGSKDKMESLLSSGEKWGKIVRAKGTVYDRKMNAYQLDYAADALTLVPTQDMGEDQVQIIGKALNAVAIRSKLSTLKRN